ncbi:MAG: hypothetical protein P4L45_14090, partial [Ignavibacteriaceae bacterium]|nr:hypothetical protein [Ignavibacteriaceae bacterium]
MKSMLTAALLLLLINPFLNAQNDSAAVNPPDSLSHYENDECANSSFNLGYNNDGICFGNSARHNGIRLNIVDCGVKEVKGINITFWKGEEKTLEDFRMSGISIGAMPCVGSSTGIAIGIAGVVAKQQLSGVNIGGLALVSGGSITGINFGGLACVSQKDMT